MARKSDSAGHRALASSSYERGSGRDIDVVAIYDDSDWAVMDVEYRPPLLTADNQMLDLDRERLGTGGLWPHEGKMVGVANPTEFCGLDAGDSRGAQVGS